MTHEEARQKIKRYIKNHGHKPVEITPRRIKYWWRIINAAVFYGRLHYPLNIETKHVKEAFATCAPEKNNLVTLKMKPMFVSVKLFLYVLAHEMVHAWEHQHHSRMGHAKRFMMWKNRLKWTVGFPLLIEMDEDEYRYV